MARWAWEFLRRNPEYIECYNEFSSGQTYKSNADFIREYEEIIISKKPLTKYWTVNKQILPGEYLKNILGKTQEECFVCSIFQTIAERFGFRYRQTKLPNPEKEYKNIGIEFIFESNIRQILFGWMFENKSHMMPEITIKKNEVLCIFNLDFPIKKQIDSAHSQLTESRKFYLDKYKSSQPVTPRNMKKMYPYYLMVLDAEAAGIKEREMAKTLLPKEPDSYPDRQATKKIHNWLVAARKIRDGGYLTLSSI